MSPTPGRDGPAVPAVLVATGGLFAVPFVALGLRALGHGSATWDALSDGRVVGPLLHTILLAVIVTVLATITGVGLAWLVARTDVPGRSVLRVAAAVPLVIPSFGGSVSADPLVQYLGAPDVVLVVRDGRAVT